MYIALASVSKDPAVNNALLTRIAAAIEIQLYRDYAPAWQAAGMSVKVFSSPTDIKDANACPIVIFDQTDDSQALGWHWFDQGRFVAKVFWDPIRQNGGKLLDTANSLSVTISHEALEAVGDPYANWWADMDSRNQEALELCDRVEGDSYVIDGVAVSNFLTPRAFRDGPGPYDFLQLLKKPWDLRPGGYAIRRNGTKVTNVWGEEMPEWKQTLKQMPGKRTATRQEIVNAIASAEG